MRGTGADRPVVVPNPGNAGGAKGPGHPGVVDGQPLRREEPAAASQAKPFVIPRQAVWKAWERVRANRGAAGIDEQSIAAFEVDLKDNLYKLWNRLSSGSYFPPPVKAVPIPKRDGSGERILGVPTVADRIAQTVVAEHLSARVEPIFHPDSYGYRPGRSALEAIETCRVRCWKYDWVVEFDIRRRAGTLRGQAPLPINAGQRWVRWILRHYYWDP